MQWLSLENVAHIFTIIGVICAVIGIYLTYLSFKADHERRKKSLTIQAYSEFTKTVQEEKDALYEKFKYKIVNKDDLFNEHDKLNDRPTMLLILKYLRFAEYLSTGVNTGVYDLSIVNRLGGKNLIMYYEQFSAIIKQLRIVNHSPSQCCEFEHMVQELKKKHPTHTIDSEGNIRLS